MRAWKFSIAIRLDKPLVICLLAVALSSLALLTLISSLTTVQAATIGWERHSAGPGGVSIYSIAVNPHLTSTMYVGTRFGIYKSLKSGDTWIDSTNDLLTDFGDVPSINAIVIHPVLSNTIYAVGNGVFKSIDGGQVWTNTNQGISTSYIQTIAINPENPDTLYVGTMGYDGDGGVFKSTNGAQSWEAINNGLPLPAYVYSIVFDPQNPNIVYAGLYGEGIYKSINAGSSWFPLNTDESIKFNRAIVIDPDMPTTLYIGTYNAGVSKSIDGGTTFTSTNQGIHQLEIISLWVADSSTIYAGTEDGGIFKSVDAGSKWTYSSFGCNSSYIQAFAGIHADPNRIYVGTKAGVCKSFDGGASWASANQGLPASLSEALLLVPGQQTITFYAGTAGGGVYTYQDNAWASSSLGISNTWIRSLAYDPITPTTLYAGTFFGGLYKSIDGGSHWTTHNLGLPEFMNDVREIIVHPMTSTIVYAGLQAGVFKSLDGGEHWTKATDGMPVSYEDIYSLAMDPSDPETLYASIGAYGVYKTINGGQVWELSNDGLTNLYIYGLAVDPNQSDIVYSGAGGALFRSINGGKTWTATNLDRTVTSIAFNPMMTNTLYAGTEGWGIYISEDGGIEWQPLTLIGFPAGTAYVYDLEFDVDAQELYVATMNGAGVFSETEITLLETPFSMPKESILAAPGDDLPISYGIYALCVSETCSAQNDFGVLLPLIVK